MLAPKSLTVAALRRLPLPSVDSQGDKETRGQVLIVGGARETPGAVLLCAIAALRAGAGKLAMGVPASIALQLAVLIPEARVIALPESKSGALTGAGLIKLHALSKAASSTVIGPGMLEDRATTAFTQALLRDFRKIPVVLDAGAMRTLVKRRAMNQPLLITPHAGEMAALLGWTKERVCRLSLAAAQEASARWNVDVVLKGAISWITGSDGAFWRFAGNSPGLGTSGSGDVLSGIAGGLIARGCACAHAACWAVVIHSKAGEALAKRHGPVGFIARELLDEIPRAVMKVQRARH